MATTKVSKGLIKDGAVTIEKLNSALVVTGAEGIVNNDNDITVPTSAAVKNYVDSSVVGGLIYQGAYDAATNTPVLDSRGTQVSVNQGWTYTVTVNGTFYGETVKVGDVLIAETDLTGGTGALTDWTTVQSNIDLATAGNDATAVRGLAGFDADNFTVVDGFVNLKVGAVTEVNNGTYITTTGSNGPIVTVNHNETSRADSTSNTSLTPGGSFTAVDTVTSNTTGHITTVNLKTVTLPASGINDLTEYYDELIYVTGLLTTIETYEDNSKAVKLFTKSLTYSVGVLTQISLLNISTNITETKTLSYDIDGNLINITKS